MNTFMAFAIGIVIGYSLGAISMVLLIKETKEDIVMERQIIYGSRELYDKMKAPELETEELEEPMNKVDIDYGNF